ncbi:hypothetical protein Salat_2594500 [Sesamum alatum]|uniref:Uncharacterized protein n=1 Tax=Sesamum alatum TaxID=300844 RepID=A0AAE2CAK5_9LAMI|nr:hypothetical protein Salat_2594500 [Sesamum alatum]
MAEDLNNLQRNLQLSDDEKQSIMMPLGLWHGDIAQQGYFLVGKLLGRRTFNFEAFKTTMLNSFNPSRGMDFRLIEDSRIRATIPAVLRTRGSAQQQPRPSLWSTLSSLPPLPANSRGLSIFSFSKTSCPSPELPHISTNNMPSMLRTLTSSSNPNIRTSIPANTSATTSNNLIPNSAILPPATIPKLLYNVPTSTHSPTLNTSNHINSPPSRPSSPSNPPRLSLPNIPLHLTLEHIPSQSPSHSTSSSLKSRRKKPGPRKIISVTKKRKLINETLDATESPSKSIKQLDADQLDISEVKIVVD